MAKYVLWFPEVLGFRIGRETAKAVFVQGTEKGATVSKGWFPHSVIRVIPKQGIWVERGWLLSQTWYKDERTKLEERCKELRVELLEREEYELQRYG